MLLRIPVAFRAQSCKMVAFILKIKKQDIPKSDIRSLGGSVISFHGASGVYRINESNVCQRHKSKIKPVYLKNF